jgi:hypothetical protein
VAHPRRRPAVCLNRIYWTVNPNTPPTERQNAEARCTAVVRASSYAVGRLSRHRQLQRRAVLSRQAKSGVRLRRIGIVLFQLVFGEGCFGSGVSHEPCGPDSGVARRLRGSSGSACAGCHCSVSFRNEGAQTSECDLLGRRRRCLTEPTVSPAQTVARVANRASATLEICPRNVSPGTGAVPRTLHQLAPDRLFKRFSELLPT